MSPPVMPPPSRAAADAPPRRIPKPPKPNRTPSHDCLRPVETAEMALTPHLLAARRNSPAASLADASAAPRRPAPDAMPPVPPSRAASAPTANSSTASLTRQNAPAVRPPCSPKPRWHAALHAQGRRIGRPCPLSAFQAASPPTGTGRHGRIAAQDSQRTGLRRWALHPPGITADLQQLLADCRLPAVDPPPQETRRVHFATPLPPGAFLSPPQSGILPGH